MLERMMEYPVWLQVWIMWLGVANFGSVFFLRHIQARWTLAAFLGAATVMSGLFALNGFNRLLGLGHVVFWTPLLPYLFRQRAHLDSGWLRSWVSVVVLTNGVSLIIDYADVARYLLGDRS